MQLDVLAERAAQQLLDIADDIVDVDDLRLDDLAAGECEQLVGQVRGTLAREADLLDILARATPAVIAVFVGRRVEVACDELPRS